MANSPLLALSGQSDRTRACPLLEMAAGGDLGHLPKRFFVMASTAAN